MLPARPTTDPVSLYRWRDGLYAADMLTAGLVGLDLFTWLERVSGVDPARLSRFAAKGMLLNVVASMDLLNSDEPWARTLIEGCREDI